MNPLRTLLFTVALSSVVGCTVHEEVVAPGPGPVVESGPDVYVAPGYYQDYAYYDVYGVYHPAIYYYYDGHHYYHRDYDHGFAYHSRPGFAPPHGYHVADSHGGFHGGGGDMHGGGGPHGR